MSKEQSTEITPWIANPESPSDMELCKTLAAKCANFAPIFENGSVQDITRFFEEMPENGETFELVTRFCGGADLNMSSENVVPISCLAHYLGMTETHCPNNLLRKALFFFEHKVLPSWNDTVKAFRTTEGVLREAVEIGIVGACVDSLVSKAVSDPFLLGEPIKKACFDEIESENEYSFRPSAKRRLYFLSWKSEDLTTLPLRLYEPLMREMLRRGVSPGHAAVSLCNYAEKWASGEPTSVYRRNSQREIIEAVARLLPDEPGLVGPATLAEMVRCASLLEAGSGCVDGLEFRLGRDLHRATVKDLLTLFKGHDVESVRRLLKHFYANYTSADVSALVRVAELVEEFLSEIAADEGLTKEAFAAMAEISTDVSRGTQRSSDGIYKGIDIYLDKHRHLTEAEREDVCRALDLHNMSPEACDHAAKNERLPVRVVLQVLFQAQLQLRDTIAREVQSSQDGRGFDDEDEDDDEEERLLVNEEYAAGMEMERMNRKLVELERECGDMKREISRWESGGGGGGAVAKVTAKREKVSLWKEMKRKLGCMSVSVSSSVSNCNNCQVKRRRKKISVK